MAAGPWHKGWPDHTGQFFNDLDGLSSSPKSSFGMNVESVRCWWILSNFAKIYGTAEPAVNGGESLVVALIGLQKVKSFVHIAAADGPS
jgi:hypothetical protein